jgi:oxygen-independent coproporphyrinogen III oxidase
VEILSPLQRAGELVMLQLRLMRGLNFADFAARTSCDARSLYAEPIARLTKLGLLEADEAGFRLSQAGLNVADAIAGEFLLTVPQ